MVSRGGRSKGCANCRKRRVKCDETRPTCLRCAKRGLECKGPKEVTWINHNTNFKTNSSTDSTSGSTSDSTSESSPETAVVVATLPPQLSFDAFGETICLAYTRKNLLRGGPVELACNMIEQHQGAPLFDNPGLDLLRQSMLSLSVTFFGKQHRQKQITSRGYAQYGEVLGQLNEHLTRPELQTTDETILTALTCMLLEIFLPTGPKNFFKHHRGLEAIMSMRGPPQATTGDTATIFRGLRILSIVGALAESRPSIYARDEWRNAPPPTDVSESAILQHHIFTCLADCTQLMGERNAILSGSAPLWAYEPLLQRVQATLEQLHTLYPLWQRFNTSQLSATKPLSRLAVQLGVANSHSATALMLYNTVHICLLQIIDSLSPSSANTAQRNHAAMTIAQCLELKEYSKREGGHESNTIGFVATKVAWQALGGFDSPEGQQLARTVESSLNCLSPMGLAEGENLEQPRPDEIRDSFFAKFVRRIPIGTPEDEARVVGLLRFPELINIGYKNSSQVSF